MKILIVDDNEILVDSLLEVLDEGKHEYRVSASGKEAVKDAGDFMPDYIVLDLNLPDIHGFEVLKKIRAGECKAKVLILSGNDEEKTISEAMRLGASGYMVKPFAPRDILKKIKTL